MSRMDRARIFQPSKHQHGGREPVFPKRPDPFRWLCDHCRQHVPILSADLGRVTLRWATLLLDSGHLIISILIPISPSLAFVAQQRPVERALCAYLRRLIRWFGTRLDVRIDSIHRLCPFNQSNLNEDQASSVGCPGKQVHYSQKSARIAC